MSILRGRVGISSCIFKMQKLKDKDGDMVCPGVRRSFLFRILSCFSHSPKKILSLYELEKQVKSNVNSI